MHQAMAATLDTILENIRIIRGTAAEHGGGERPRWPMLVLRTPKGWTGPKQVDGLPVEGSFRSHQVPLSDPANNPEHLQELESWLRSYRPQDLFDANGTLLPELAAIAPEGERRMGANPHANGGLLLKDLLLLDFRDFAVKMKGHEGVKAADQLVLGEFLAEGVRQNATQPNFPRCGPDETVSNPADAAFKGRSRQWG